MSAPTHPSKTRRGKTFGRKIPESLLARLWKEQAVRQKNFKTTEGRHVRILYPGRRGTEAGPDFRDALIYREGTGLVRGGRGAPPHAPGLGTARPRLRPPLQRRSPPRRPGYPHLSTTPSWRRGCPRSGPQIPVRYQPRYLFRKPKKPRRPLVRPGVKWIPQTIQQDRSPSTAGTGGKGALSRQVRGLRRLHERDASPGNAIPVPHGIPGLQREPGRLPGVGPTRFLRSPHESHVTDPSATAAPPDPKNPAGIRRPRQTRRRRPPVSCRHGPPSLAPIQDPSPPTTPAAG